MCFCRRSCYDALPAAGETPNTGDWLKVRRFHICCLCQTTSIILLLLTLTEALALKKGGPLELVYAGQQGFPPPGENDFGITYTIAYILSYLYLCAFMIIYIPFFSWIPRLFLPTKIEIPTRWIQAFNMLCTLLSAIILIEALVSALFYAIILIYALVYVDERHTRFFQLPNNTKQIWKSRALMVTFIAISIGLGYGAFSVLEMAELARVKTFEYVAIVVPVQINIGMIFATMAQKKMEKTAAIKAARREQHVEEQGSLAGVVDEKMSLMAGE